MRADIGAVVDVAHAAGAIVKVILENAYLTDDEKVRGCRAAESAGADFVKTSTGFAPGGATHEDLALMRRTVSDRVQVKAAGGVRTLDDLLAVMALGVTRIGATQTKPILDEYRSRRAGRDAGRGTCRGPRRVLSTNQRDPTTKEVGTTKTEAQESATHDGSGCPRWRRRMQGEGVKAR